MKRYDWIALTVRVAVAATLGELVHLQCYGLASAYMTYIILVNFSHVIRNQG